MFVVQSDLQEGTHLFEGAESERDLISLTLLFCGFQSTYIGKLDSSIANIMGRKLGIFRAVYLVSASCMGSFAFAFDTGIISLSILDL